MKNPHPDTIVVSTKNLKEFQEVCNELGIDYDIYACPIPISGPGNCLIKLSLDDINLLVMTKPNNILQSKLGMRVYMDNNDLFMYHKTKIDLSKIHAELEYCNRYYKDHC